MPLSKPYGLVGEVTAAIHQHIVGGPKHIAAAKREEIHPHVTMMRAAVSDDLPSGKKTCHAPPLWQEEFSCAPEPCKKTEDQNE
jgi:hypothetical protein